MVATSISGTQNSTLEATLDRLNAPSVLSSSNGLGSLDSTDFLTLMTTQLQFQDPLEPASNEDMLAQMAQFTSLAQTEASGTTLEDISAKLDALIDAQMAAAEAAQAAADAAAQASASNSGTAAPAAPVTPSAPPISALA